MTEENLKEPVHINDMFHGLVQDTRGDLICVGCAYSHDGSDGVVVRYNRDMRAITRRHYCVPNIVCLQDASIGKDGTIFCAGKLVSDVSSGGNGIVLKLGADLKIITKRKYSNVGNNGFYGIAAAESNNVIGVGYTGYKVGCNTIIDSLMVKFDADLNIVKYKHHGCSAGVELLQSVQFISEEHSICVGCSKIIKNVKHIHSSALVLSLDSNLEVTQYHLCTYADSSFYGCTIDNNGDIVCVGQVVVDNVNHGLVVKYSHNLKPIIINYYTIESLEKINNVTVDDDNNIICVGVTAHNDDRTYDSLIMKLDQSLDVIDYVLYKNDGKASRINSVVYSDDRIFCAGHVRNTEAETSGILVKYSRDLTLCGTIL